MDPYWYLNTLSTKLIAEIISKQSCLSLGTAAYCPALHPLDFTSNAEVAEQEAPHTQGFRTCSSCQEYSQLL